MKTSVQLVIVHPEESGQKLLAFVRARLGQRIPEGLFMRVVRTGQVRIDGKRCKPFDRVLSGQTVRIPPVDIDEPIDISPAPELPLERIFENEEMVAVHKPSGLPVHGGTGWSDSLRDRVAAYPWGTPFVPVPVHRLDRDTSGVVLCAKTHACVRAMHALWPSVTKAYLCWVRGAWTWVGWQTFSDPLEKQQTARGERMVAGVGKEATTHACALDCRPESSLLLVVLGTGRTHQIRVHLAQAGYPILGDGKYGAPGARMLLHAAILHWSERTLICWPDWPTSYAVDPLLRERIPQLLLSAPAKEAAHV